MNPHVMHSIEELSYVKDLNNWSNNNVQFIGKLLLGIDGVYMCEGIEKNSSVKIAVDFSLTAQIPPRNAVVRIWGELELKHIDNQTVTMPFIKAKIARVIKSVDIPLYRRSLEIRREYAPHNYVSLTSTSKKPIH
ncbi:uncharacterized protein LOC124209827 [Daphnia pulex]|uniref:uncharacterized protein LOC124209827 n=1 Tax=Daphnia pulex TaxID=6669 RepID=UPI001EDD0574|nr:uncharacterized protein LOC124209827 [Daphnia pulex]XP_046650828.1 uncharacterized protein LOC124341918 [Daphnia pulicaria]